MEQRPSTSLAAYTLKQRHRQQNQKTHHQPYIPLNHETLNLVLDGADLAHKVTSLVGSDTGGDHRTGDTGGTAQGELAGDVHIRNVLVFSKQRQVKKNGQRRGVGGQDDNLGSSAVEGLGGC